MAEIAPELWHFTCEHGYAGLRDRGLLRPNRHPLLPHLGPVIWMTMDPEPKRDAVGLSASVLLTCDRMAYRYSVRPAPSCVSWMEVRDEADPRVLATLESFGAPETWWISRLPLYATIADG